MSSPFESCVPELYSDRQIEAIPNLQGNIIPCHVDLASGSLKSAEKRRENTQSVQRYRRRKREAQYAKHESFIKQLHDYKDKIGQLELEVRNLEKQLDHYRKERNFYRDRVILHTTEENILPSPYIPPLGTSQEPVICGHHRSCLN